MESIYSFSWAVQFQIKRQLYLGKTRKTHSLKLKRKKHTLRHLFDKKTTGILTTGLLDF